MAPPPVGPKATPLFQLYRAATRLLVPLAYQKERAKLAHQGVPSDRQRERLGYATARRPNGRLIWFHGASVGESQAAISLMNHLTPKLPGASFLLTSGTATSAEMAAKRMPANCLHQFAPLDGVTPVKRFLNHWRPDVGLFVDSELWPVTLVSAHSKGCRLALVNARMSRKTVERWQKQGPTARFILSQFDLLLSQNTQAAEDLLTIGAPKDRVHIGGNLKAKAPPLPVEQSVVADLRAQLAGRPLWVASSTHKGEEETILKAHKGLLKSQPDLCLLLAPRHPERGAEVANLIADQGLQGARRSRGQALQTSTQVYLADTLGELGNWYALSPIVFLGGSLLPIGGHNPFEVIQGGGAVITGSGYSNFTETFPPLLAAGGAVEANTPDEIGAAVLQWLQAPGDLVRTQKAGQSFLVDQAAQLDASLDLLVQHLLT